MSDYEKYSKLLARSVSHIFKQFLDDHTIEEIFESQSKEKDPQVAVEIEGSLRGELLINFPIKTLDAIAKKFLGTADSRTLKRNYSDVAGEIANLVTGTFANQLQYLNHAVRLNPPEFNDDPISLKTLYENINMSFISRFGGFDVDFYYKEKKE